MGTLRQHSFSTNDLYNWFGQNRMKVGIFKAFGNQPMNSEVISQLKHLSPFCMSRASEPRRLLWMQQRGFGGRWVGASLAARTIWRGIRGRGHGGASNCEVWRDCAPSRTLGALAATCLCCPATPSCDTGGHLIAAATQGGKKAQKITG